MTTPPGYGRPLTLDDARPVMEAAEREAARQGWPIVVAIVDGGGHLVMLHRAGEAQHGSVGVARQKAETAVAFKRPTKAIEDAVAGGGVNLRILTIPCVAVDGGLPLMRDGRIVGAIGASGMLPAQDAQVAAAGAAAFA